jgi:hypothetical protein
MMSLTSSYQLILKFFFVCFHYQLVKKKRADTLYKKNSNTLGNSINVFFIYKIQLMLVCKKDYNSTKGFSQLVVCFSIMNFLFQLIFFLLLKPDCRTQMSDKFSLKDKLEETYIIISKCFGY